MCWANKCCFFMRVDLGCTVLGIANFIFSAVFIVTSVIFLVIGGHEDEKLLLNKHKEHHVWYLRNSTLIIILWSTLILGLASMFASSLLIVGVRKGKAGLVLCYFAHGVVLTIVCQLAALLALLDGHWITTLIIFIVTMVYIHFLVVVSTFYEGLQKGRQFGFGPHQNLDEDELFSSTDSA